MSIQEKQQKYYYEQLGICIKKELKINGYKWTGNDELTSLVKEHITRTFDPKKGSDIYYIDGIEFLTVSYEVKIIENN